MKAPIQLYFSKTDGLKSVLASGLLLFFASFLLRGGGTIGIVLGVMILCLSIVSLGVLFHHVVGGNFRPCGVVKA